MTTNIENDDVEGVRDDYENGRMSATLNDYFSAASYAVSSYAGRNEALIELRGAWVQALAGANATHAERTLARHYVMANEYFVRESIEADGGGIAMLAWNPQWPMLTVLRTEAEVAS